MNREKKIACFDVDGTIFRSSLLIEVVEELIRQGSFPASSATYFEKPFSDWVNRRGSYENYISRVVEAFVIHIKGLPREKFANATSAVISLQRDRVYRYTRDLVASLKDDGYYLLAISHSPKWLLDEFCIEYGFDKVYGKHYIIGDDGKFTGGILNDSFSMNKAEVLKSAVEIEGLTLNESVGVGDTEGDIPMLSLVSRPICFNPNQSLFTYAKEQHWEVVVERKDVIYQI